MELDTIYIFSMDNENDLTPYRSCIPIHTIKSVEIEEESKDEAFDITAVQKNLKNVVSGVGNIVTGIGKNVINIGKKLSALDFKTQANAKGNYEFKVSFFFQKIHI